MQNKEEFIFDTEDYTKYPAVLKFTSICTAIQIVFIVDPVRLF